MTNGERDVLTEKLARMFAAHRVDADITIDALADLTADVFDSMIEMRWPELRANASSNRGQ